jgi:hypothetical protein
MGNTSEARSTADKALTSATEAKDTDYADAIKELITDMNKVKAPVKPSKK